MEAYNSRVEGNRELRIRWLKLTLAVVVFALAGAESAWAAKKPDLVVKSVESPPAEVSIGDEMPVEVTIQNKGKKTARASKLGLAFSETDSPSADPAFELPALNTKKIKPKKSLTVSGEVDVPEDAEPGGAYYLLACADEAGDVKESKESNNCGASGNETTLRSPPSVFELIDAEYEAGDITLGEALLFKAYADTSDPALPERFGPPPPADGTDGNVVPKQISAQIETLPQADLEKVDPFLKPPIYEGAYFPGEVSRREVRRGTLGGSPCAGPGTPPTVSAGWSSLSTTHFKIHYYTQKPTESAEDPAQSLQVAQWLAAEAEKVYTDETARFKAPLTDGGLDCNGGDALLDIYAVGMSWTKSAQVKPYPPGEVKRPGWAWIDPGDIGSAQDARDTLAHEFFHMISLNYDLFKKGGDGPALEYGWLDEATANWAIDFVYKTDNFEHRYADWWYERGAWNEPMGECTSYGCGNGYRDYLFFLFLTRSAGSTALMHDIWAATETTGSVEAVNQGLGGQYAEKWKEFAVHTINRGEQDDFTGWDGITNQLDLGPRCGVSCGPALERYDGHMEISLNGQQTRTQLPLLPLLDTHPKEFQYYSYEFSDASVRDVTFKGYGYVPGSGGLTSASRITAWYELQNGDTGTWNWTSGAEQHFCREKPDENLKRLVLFYTNGQPTPFLSGGGAPSYPLDSGQIVSKDSCPIVGFNGTFSGVSNRSGGGVTDITVTWNGDMHLILHEGPFASGVEYEADSGVLNVESIEGTVGNCTLTGGPETYTLPVAGEQPGGQLPLTRISRFPQGWRIGSLWPIGNPPPTIPITYDCPDDTETQNDPLLAYGQWLSYNPDFMQLHPQNGLQVTDLHVDQDGEWTHDLTFQYLPEYED